MLNSIKASFPHCDNNNCLVVSANQEIRITDVDDSHCMIVEQGNDVFVLSNPTQKNIYVLFIDKCIFGKAQQHKRCDCAAFDEKKFCFIEFKKTINKKEEYISTAADQLFVTLDKFKEKNINFIGFKLEAWVSFTDDPPVPAALTGNQIQQARFLMYHNSDFYTGLVLFFLMQNL